MPFGEWNIQEFSFILAGILYSGPWFWTALPLLTFLLAVLLYLPCKTLAVQLKLIDYPDKRKDHEKATPYAGGLMLVLAAHISLAILLFTGWSWPGTSPDLKTIIWIVIGANCLFLLGLIDDQRNLGSLIKLSCQAIITVFVVFMGVSGEYFMEGSLLGEALSILWILGITNAFNMLDNMNGLSAGVAIIALGLFATVTLMTGQTGISVVLLILLGSMLGFFLFNFPRAKVFLGDGGAYFIGFWIACLTVTATFYFKSDADLPVLVVTFPLLVMAVPIYDTASVVLIRLIHRKPIMEGDRNHFSHRLEAMGLSRTEAVIVIWVLTLAVGLASILMYFMSNTGCIIALAQVMLVLLLVFLLERAGKRGNS